MTKHGLVSFNTFIIIMGFCGCWFISTLFNLDLNNFECKSLIVKQAKYF